MKHTVITKIWKSSGASVLGRYTHPLALTTARDLAYQRRLSSLEGRDLRTQSMNESMEKREMLVWT